MIEAIERTAEPWAGDDPFTEAIRSGRGPLWLREPNGRRHRLDVERWCGPVDAADRRLLRACARGELVTSRLRGDRGRRLSGRAGGRLRPGPVLDVGCGPGRLVTELLALGIPALGVDLAEASVRRTRAAGGTAVCRSVFDRLPGEGRWRTVLLADGNLGIGGDPARLFRRIGELLAPGGLLLAEVEPHSLDERLTVQTEDGAGRLGAPFVWARLGADAAARHASLAGLTEREAWQVRGRHFVAFSAP